MDTDDIERITCEELKRLRDEGQKVAVVDTRQASAYDIDHISGAINMYYNSAGDPMDRILMLPALPSDGISVFYCDCLDDSTSALMAIELINLGYDPSRVRALRGGYSRWKELDYPVE